MIRQALIVTALFVAACATDPSARRTATPSLAPLPPNASTSDALAATEPAAVAPADRRAYFDAVTQTRRSTLRGAHAPMGEPTEPNADDVQKILALAPLVGASDPELDARIRAWLFACMKDYAQAYAFQNANVRASPAGGGWHRTEAAWVRWLMAQLPTLTEPEANDVVWTLMGHVPEGVDAYPGLDRLALGAAVVDLWTRSGRPKADRSRVAYETVVCPVYSQYGRLYSSCGGRSWWYREAIANDTSARRLARFVLERKDPELTVNGSVAIGRTPQTLTFLRDLERDPVVWQRAIIAVANEEADRTWMQSWMLPELRRVWRSQPAARGAILYALAEASGEHADELPDGVGGFTHFAREFEGGVTRADFVSFLDQAPRAIELAKWIMPARTKGWSVADILVQRLDAYLALPPDVPAMSPRGPGLERLVGHLCYRDHDMSEIGKLRTYFERRAASHPGDKLNVLVDSFTPAACRARN
jgi:hypothetical protein